ncbi:MAG: cytochrome C [Desulfuromonas sp.]|nr:MAG: cytochrome C [Desulfuromonas sp.]
MKTGLNLALAFAFLALLPPSQTSATETPNLELGKTLFHATSLGTNGKSCASCHPDGEGLHEIEAYDEEMLREMVNFCIRDALKGKMLPLDSQEIVSMERYLRTLD